MCQVDNIELFAPDDTGVANGNYFGFPFTVDHSRLVLISVPWDATVSYADGTANGPQAIMDATLQVEIYDPHFPQAWRGGIATLDAVEYAQENNTKTREIATQIIANLESGGTELPPSQATQLLEQANNSCEQMNHAVYTQAKKQLNQGRLVGLVGGDHSTPLGLIKALGEKNEPFGILHIDAHADLRDAYEGFTYSHASIMRNTLKEKMITALVQVGLRDFSQGEKEFASSDPRIVQFTDHELKENAFSGHSWNDQCLDIISRLPNKVYISFDIDGLSPLYCPSTGTPVPGGLAFAEAVYLIKKLVDSGRVIVGFDLTEVSPGDTEWDANVGARILYKLCGATLVSQQTK